METPASTAPQLWKRSYESIAAILLMVALSPLIFGVGSYLRRGRKLAGVGAAFL